MAKYLISFPSPAMNIPEEDWAAAGEAARAAAIEWAAKIARACRCSQELREFQYDPES